METDKIGFVPIWYVDGRVLKGWVEEAEFKSGCEEVTIYVFDFLLSIQEKHEYEELFCFGHTKRRKRIYIFTEQPTEKGFFDKMWELGFSEAEINYRDFLDKMQGDKFVFGSENKYVPDVTYVDLFKNS